jgi:hypothetical protein
MPNHAFIQARLVDSLFNASVDLSHFRLSLNRVAWALSHTQATVRENAGSSFSMVKKLSVSVRQHTIQCVDFN